MLYTLCVDINREGISLMEIVSRTIMIRGPYCVYIDIKKRLVTGRRLLQSAINNRHHVKISLNWKNITPAMVFNIFIPNIWHMLNDIYLKDPQATLMRHTVEHAKRTHDIVDAIVSHTSLTREAILIQGEEKACYVGFAGSTPPEEHFKWLNKYTNIPFYAIDHTKTFGKEVQQVLTFPRDGLMCPWIFENLSEQLERDVQVGTKTYRFFAIQMTGGGNFSSRKVRPDYLVNLLHTTEQMYRLTDPDDILYDCVQSRGCGRGVSAKNSVSFAQLADNAVVGYAQGGIGMTTMFPNGELMIQLLEQGKGQGAGSLVDGLIGNARLQRRIYRKRNVLGEIDYTHLVDPQGKVARLFGWWGDSSSYKGRKPTVL